MLKCACVRMGRRSLCFFVHRLLKRPIGQSSIAFLPSSVSKRDWGAVWPVWLCSKRTTGVCFVYKCSSSVVCPQTTLTLHLFPYHSFSVHDVNYCLLSRKCVCVRVWILLAGVLRQSWGRCDPVCQLLLFRCCWKRMNELFFYCSIQSIRTLSVGALSRLLPCIF